MLKKIISSLMTLLAALLLASCAPSHSTNNQTTASSTEVAKKKDLKDMGQPLVTDAPNEHQTAKGDNLKEHNQAHPQEKGGEKHGDHHHKKSKAIPFKHHQ